MGWEIHITRAEDWAASEENPIRAEEWLALVEADPELKIDPRNNGSCFTLWLCEVRDGEHPWFDWDDGQIHTKHPDRATLGKALEIAHHFGARVLGDDGEEYQRPEDLEESSPEARASLSSAAVGASIRKPPLRAMILADYASVFCSIVPLMTWATYAMIEFSVGKLPDTAALVRFFFWYSIVASAVCGLVLCWRIGKFRAMLNRGIHTPAILSGVQFGKNRGRIEYQYDFQGQDYQGGMAIMYSKRTRGFQVGQEISVLVDPRHPSKAIVLDVFGS